VQHKNGKFYPRETSHFVVPPEVAKIYGDKPTELDIMIPVEQDEVSFPQAYEYYGSGKGLICTGNGEVAYCAGENGEIEEKDCPCELLDQGKCKQRGHLSVLLPKVSVGGVHQCDTSSFNSIIDINSSLDYVRSLVGRVAMVPLTLLREARETHFEGRKQTHYTLRMEFKGNIDTINQLRKDTQNVLSGPQLKITAPAHENPVFDDDATVVLEGELDSDEVPASSVIEEAEAKTIEQQASAFVDAALIDDLLAEARSVKDLEDVADKINKLPKKDRMAAGKKLSARYQELQS